MSVRSLRPVSLAVLVALAALTAGTPWAPKVQRGDSARLLAGPQTAHAQSAAACTAVSCQQDYSSASFWVVKASGPRAANGKPPYLTAGGWPLYALYTAENVCRYENGVRSSCSLRRTAAQPGYKCTTELCRLFRFLSPEHETLTACTDASCSSSHPPFLLPAGGVTVDSNAGIDGSFGSLARSDGLQQVTFNRSTGAVIPLYFCSCDLQPGGPRGDDVNDQWGTWLAARP